MTLDDRLRALLQTGVSGGVFPAAGAWIAADGVHRATAYAGAATPDTIWDLASLTKPIAVVTTAMRAVGDGRLGLDDPVRSPAGLDTTVRDLLAHRSGLPAWDDLWAVAETLGAWQPGSDAVRDAVAARIGALAGTASGTIYSDLGFISLGWHLEATLGQPLRDAIPGYRGSAPASPGEGPFAPTGACPRRDRELAGEVHDLNTWVLGGAAGHAGLFWTLDDVGRWALDLARTATGRPTRGLDPGVVRAFWDLDQRQGDATWVLGWDTPSPGASSAGRRVGPGAVGHLGFTGTSVWLDRDAGLTMVLLTNRVAAPDPDQGPIRAFRPWFHDAVRDVFDR